MVHIVEHHNFVPEDFPMEEEAASSTPRASSHPAPGAAAAMRSARQHTPAQTSRASRAAPGALSAARELLRHPLSSMALPGAMKQWRDDVDRLLGMVHSASARPRPRSSRRQHEASASVRSPSVRAAPTEDLRAELNRRRAGEDALDSLEGPDDLRAELNRRRAGEDAHVSLERACERRQNIEVRNLDGRLDPDRCPVGRRGLRRTHGSPPRGDVAIQVLATPAEKVRRYVKPVGIPAGIRHCHHDSRWRHCCDGNILPCSLVRAGPDLAHEPCPRIDLLLGRALRAVHRELRQRLPTAWRGGTPPCSEAGTRGNSPSIHLLLH
jgi:hypothetical protein